MFLDYLFIYLLSYSLTHSMQHNLLWKTNHFSASQEIPRILRNTKVHHRVCNSLLPVSVQSQINPVYASHIQNPEYPS
jgi:hypothetical protein